MVACSLCDNFIIFFAALTSLKYGLFKGSEIFVRQKSLCCVSELFNMKFYVQIVTLLMINTVEWFGEVQCKPHGHVRKIINIERKKLPLKHVSLSLQKLTPFGKFEFKHVINKRQAEVPQVIEKEVSGGTIDAITEAKEIPVETHSEPDVIITSIIKPIDNEPVAVPVPEILPVELPPPQLLPPPPPPPLPPLPPVIKEDPPPKAETPNIFVKGSRLVLFVGSMMLQMLSKFVNGGFNINQIPIPIIPEVQ
ncbi:SET-binding protein-like isoform X2 [Danaus plexippus]|uniref:SET-binding protein-like isoform X2 n=1 Tax=Danaus plexippus TaxID=13037 RepID=UPI002AB0F7A7|nr:SET-binding protein-like isoform X2 [Danaus plexippus]